MDIIWIVTVDEYDDIEVFGGRQGKSKAIKYLERNYGVVVEIETGGEYWSNNENADPHIILQAHRVN